MSGLLGHRELLMQTAGGGGGYLDAITPAPRAALSLRKLISTATAAIRVRRSSDNAEQDIGFTGSALDTTSLASFVGANSAFVTTVYDQTGNGFHKVQATAANQPRIVNAGAIDVALIYDGTSDSMSIPSLPFGTSYAALYTKCRLADQVAVGVLYETSTSYSLVTGRFIVYVESNKVNVGCTTSSAHASVFDPTNQTALQQNTFIYQMAVSDATIQLERLFINSTEIGRVSAAGSAGTVPQNFATNTMYIGARAGSSLFYPLWDETLVIYDADTTSVRASIEAIVA